MEVFRQDGTLHCVKFKILIKIPSWSAQSFSTCPGRPSGPTDLCGLTPHCPTVPLSQLFFLPGELRRCAEAVG